MEQKKYNRISDSLRSLQDQNAECEICFGIMMDFETVDFVGISTFITKNCVTNAETTHRIDRVVSIKDNVIRMRLTKEVDNSKFQKKMKEAQDISVWGKHPRTYAELVKIIPEDVCKKLSAHQVAQLVDNIKAAQDHYVGTLKTVDLID